MSVITELVVFVNHMLEHQQIGFHLVMGILLLIYIDYVYFPNTRLDGNQHAVRIVVEDANICLYLLFRDILSRCVAACY